MPQILKIACAQSRTLSTTAATLDALERTTRHASSLGIDILLFPEAYLGGYPRTCTFGSCIGSRSDAGRAQFLRYFRDAVDLGDTPSGGGAAWVERRLELPRGKQHRGDGTRERLERIARETGVLVVTGLVERSGGTLYCGVVFVCPRLGVLGKRRKVMPTGSERLVWGQGAPSTLRAVTTTVKGVRLCMGAAICWENYMPLLRQSLYAQNVNLWFAPTADARETWEALMRTIGMEGRCAVVSANQCVREDQLPGWITGKEEADEVSGSEGAEEASRPPGTRLRRKSTITVTEENHEICWPTTTDDDNKDSPLSSEHIEDPIAPAYPPPTVTRSVPSDSTNPMAQQPCSPTSSSPFVCRGGSSIISPLGKTLAGPLWETQDELLVADVDFDDCERGRLDLDVAGSYGRLDSFHLSVDGLDLDPPP